jgi:hypothetical protein
MSVAREAHPGRLAGEALMLRSPNTLSTLLRISRDLDIVGDVTATVDTPSALLAWAHALPEPIIRAGRADDSTTRYVHVSATCHRAPLRGQVTAVLNAEPHRAFWSALLPQDDLTPGQQQLLPLSTLIAAWSTTTPQPGDHTRSITPTTSVAPTPQNSRDAR